MNDFDHTIIDAINAVRSYEAVINGIYDTAAENDEPVDNEEVDYFMEKIWFEQEEFDYAIKEIS